MQTEDRKVGMILLIDWLRLQISVCRILANILFKGVVVQCDVLTECALSRANVMIVSVTKMKTINLSKGLSIFLPINFNKTIT